MKVRIVYYGQAREAAGVDQEEVEAPDGATVAVAVGQAAARRGERLKRLLLTEDGRVRGSILATVNGAAAGGESAAPAGGEICLFPALAGG